jgi:hypothetical protein
MAGRVAAVCFQLSIRHDDAGARFDVMPMQTLTMPTSSKPKGINMWQSSPIRVKTRRSVAAA